MKCKILSLLLALNIAAAANAQTDTSLSFTPIQKDTAAATTNGTAHISPIAGSKLGDPAPPVRVKEWIKGSPVTTFEKGKIYVIDFWATWCAPCVAAMPHLSALARKYKGRVSFSAISILEDRGTKGATIQKLRAFVNSMGAKMDVNVAADDSDFTEHHWLDSFNYHSIPVTFIVNGEGRVVWNGRPVGLDSVLKKVVNNTWEINGELLRRAYIDSHVSYLIRLDTSVISKVRRFEAPYSGPNYLGFPDSTLMIINDMVKKEPKLKYAPVTADYTFSALLLTDPHKAYEYGRQVMVTPTYERPAYESIINNVRTDARKLSPTKEIYLLGAECYQAKIDSAAELDEYDLAIYYREMADWYYKGGDKEKAIAAEKKVITYWKKQLKNDSK